MSNLSDKEIDRLSREAADSYEPESSSLSWSRLEQMLSEQMPGRPPDGFSFGRINPYIWGPAVVLLAGISYYLIKNKFYSQLSTQTTHSISRSIPSSDPISKAGLTDEKAISANKNSDKEMKASSGADLTETAKVATNPPSKEKTNVSIQRNSNQKISVNLASGSGNKENNNKSEKNKLSQNGFALIPLTADGDAANTGINPSNKKNGNNGRSAALSAAPAGAAQTRIPSSMPPLVFSAPAPGNVKGNDSLLNRASPSTVVVPQKTLHINRSLNFGFAFGPDYTNAGGISNNQFSNNIGITLGYYLTDKISVNTGIFYANKFFWSPGYGPGRPQQSITYPNVTAAAPTIEYVNGSWNMYELPLTFRYDFAHSEKTKFFVNAGLSSYFIINQTYIYFFHSGFRPSAWKRTDNSQENNWFSVGNLSLGMETDIGKGFSFQAEPFLKIPLKQMGLENVKVNTFGFLLSFRYSPVLNRSKK
jgi:hypothetical protein